MALFILFKERPDFSQDLVRGMELKFIDLMTPAHELMRRVFSTPNGER